jgi:hypothetical protein
MARFIVQPHAAQRYVERINKKLSVDEAKDLIATQIETAVRLKERTDKGHYIYEGEDLTRFVVRPATDDKVLLIVITVLRPDPRKVRYANSIAEYQEFISDYVARIDNLKQMQETALLQKALEEKVSAAPAPAPPAVKVSKVQQPKPPKPPKPKAAHYVDRETLGVEVDILTKELSALKQQETTLRTQLSVSSDGRAFRDASVVLFKAWKNLITEEEALEKLNQIIPDFLHHMDRMLSKSMMKKLEGLFDEIHQQQASGLTAVKPKE